MFLYVIGTLGISAGVHRLWAHKAYKARLPMRMLLTFFNSIAFQVRQNTEPSPSGSARRPAVELPATAARRCPG